MDPADRTRAKILTRQELLALRTQARAGHRTVVQCHGCFDIVHPGHVRHLQHAARQGDMLLVTLTGDAVMSKGDGRPLIPQELRAENLAALDCVDWVYINPLPTAAELLEEVRPDVYIKGREYENNRDPRFQAEREAVERHGGRVLFSSGDIVFSSTALIAAMESSADPFQARLRQLVEAHALTPANLDLLIDSFAGKRLCVIGETITDTYVMCDRPDIAGESPVMSLRPLEHRSFDGGAAVIARHAAALGARPVLITCLPRTPGAESLRQRLAVEGVETRAIEHEGSIPEKQRFLVGSQKVMKLDLVRPISLDAAAQERLIGLARETAQSSDGAVVADFGNGMLTPGVLGRLCPSVRRNVGVMVGDVSGRRGSLLHMRDMDLLTPTEPELRDALRDYDDSLNAVVWKLMEQTGAARVFVTMGADGLTAFERLRGAGATDGWATRVRGEHVPALSPWALDALGCGDALLAAATLTMLAEPKSGDLMAIAAFLGSIAAAVEATRLGNEPVSARDLRHGVRRVGEMRLELTPPRPGVRLVV